MTILPFSLPRPRSLRTAPDGHVPVALADGGTASLRPLGHGETEPLHAVFAQMSAASRYSRYLAGTPRLPAALVRRADRRRRPTPRGLAGHRGRHARPASPATSG